MVYLAFLRRKFECLYLDVLLRKHKKRFAVLRKVSVRSLGTRCGLGAYQFRLFRPSKEQRLEDSLGPSGRRYGVLVLNPCLGEL